MTRQAGLTERQRYWLEHLEACERSGETTKAYAKAHGLSPSMMYSWRKELTIRGVWSRRCGMSRPSTFDRVEVVGEASPLLSTWRIVLPNGVQIGFSGIVDEAGLAAVLGAAKAR